MEDNTGVGSTLLRAWTLLCKNWVVMVPSVVLGVISAIAAAALSRYGFLSWTFFGDLNAQGPNAFWLFFATIVAVALRIVAAVVVIAFTTGMAAAAWRSGAAHLSDGAAAFRRSGVQAFFALLLMTVLGLIAAALLIPTFGLSVLLYMTFMLYVMPGVLVGNRGATDAIVESIALAWKRFGVTFVVVLLVIGLAILGGWLGDLLARLPLLGNVLGWVVMELVVAYATLVVVGEYLELGAPAGKAS